ncbi:MAG: hypothetical protein WA708_08565 [Acidobacteriaceae bacterium]
MYVPHYSVALAASPYARRAPLWALLTGAFLPDLVWIVLARAGVEPADAVHFFDDWSHSLLSVIVLATVFSLLFWRSGRAAVLAIWLVVCSHFVLDFPVHPKRIAAYPLAHLRLGSDAWIAWGSRNGWLGWNNDWWLQLFVLLFFLAVYAIGARRHLPGKVIAASCVALIALQLITLAPCVGY